MGHNLVDTCSFWVSNLTFTTMSLRQIDFSQVLSDDQVYDHMMASYHELGREWIVHQWNWMNNTYQAFRDHYKYLIVISLVEKTLQFYDQMNIQYSFDQFYSKTYLHIEKFSITELCDKLQLPKETVRRKVLELEKLGVLKRIKKQIIIDRSVFPQIKPERQVKSTARYIYLISKIFNKEKIFLKKTDISTIENTMKKNFSICWRWFYRMQIPIVIGYHEMFEDVATFHIWGTIAMNQAFNLKNFIENTNIKPLINNYEYFNESLLEHKGKESGVSAMSISDMTLIPRATVIRKCKYLVKHNYVTLNEKKQYVLTSLNKKKILPYQRAIFRNKAKFLRKVLNLLTIS